jgi:hypothetical protein
MSKKPRFWCQFAPWHKYEFAGPLGRVGGSLWECSTCGMKWARSNYGQVLPYSAVKDFYDRQDKLRNDPPISPQP